jgi:putative transposase
MLRREGFEISMNRTRNIYPELGLQLRNKKPKRSVKEKLRDDRKVAKMPNETCAMAFVHDQLATGRKLSILTIVDTHKKCCPAINLRFTYRAVDVVQTLEAGGGAAGARDIKG